MVTKTSGNNFNIVVTTWTFPDSFTPKELIHVNNQIMAKLKAIAAMAEVANTGKNTLNALTIAIAIAALAIQQLTQYPQATKNPMKSPKPSFEYV